MDNFDDIFGEEDDFEKALRESQFREEIEQIEKEDADYQIGIIREYGLRTWFRASKFSDIEEAISILDWCRLILERPSIEDYESCALLRDSIKWLKKAWKDSERYESLQTKPSKDYPFSRETDS